MDRLTAHQDAPAAPTLSRPQQQDSRAGLAYGLAAYVTWGLAPVYYKQMGTTAPSLILAHRVFWSVVFLVPMVHYRGLWGEVGRALRSRRTLLMLIASTVLISTNWYTFLYSVSTNQVMASSLGYYINPLVVVLLGVFFLKERLRAWQIVSLAMAAAAVAFMTIEQGKLPVISLVLAISFSLYGFLRKLVDAGPMVGLFIETLILLPIVSLLIGRDIAANGFSRPGAIYALLAGAGILTAVPLVWFANAARKLRMSTMGLLQYLTPTASFLLAVKFFHEPFTAAERIAFPMIWAALVIYSLDSYRGFRKRAAMAEEPVLSDL